MKFISRAAGLAAATLVAGTMAAVAPANAASGPLKYTCGVPLFGNVVNYDFDAKVDTNLPATMVAGTSAPLGVTAEASVPAELSELAYGFLAARSADGTAALNVKINDQVVGPVAATIPRTAMAATGPLPLPVTGTGAAFAPKTAGTYAVTAADFTATIKFYDENNTEKIEVTASCTPKTVDDNGTPEDPADDKPFVQNLTVDTVQVSAAPPAPPAEPEPEPVVKADTKTKVNAKFLKKKRTIKAVVKVRGGSTKATGKAKVVVKRGKKTIKKRNVRIKNGKAVVKVKKINRNGKYKVVVTYKGDKTHKRSKGKAVVKVKM